MNQFIKRALGAALSLTVAMSVLSGCGASAADPIKEMMGEESDITSQTVMLTVNGNEITAGDLFFWLGQSATEAVSYNQALASANGGGTEVDWSSEAGQGKTLADYVKDNAKQQAVLYNIVAAKAMENGFEFTKEDKAAYEEELAQAKEDLGGEETYQNWLKSNCITEEGMEKLSSVGVLFNHMQEGLFRDGGEYAPTPETLSTFATENDYLCAKHILLLTQDQATGQPLSDEEIAAKRATAEDLLAQLKAVQDPAQLEETFDTLMKENSEDTGLETNPDGYAFTAGQMVSQFEDATRALEFGQVSDIVESDYGFHIILRLDPAQAACLRSQWAQQELDKLVDQWVDEAEIEETEAFTNLDIEEFYTKLTAYQQSLDAAQTEEEDAGADAEVLEEAEAAEEEIEATEEAGDTGTEEAPQTEEQQAETEEEPAA